MQVLFDVSERERTVVVDDFIICMLKIPLKAIQELSVFDLRN